jgi:hypothetical protein
MVVVEATAAEEAMVVAVEETSEELQLGNPVMSVLSLSIRHGRHNHPCFRTSHSYHHHHQCSLSLRHHHLSLLIIIIIHQQQHLIRSSFGICSGFHYCPF